MLELDCHQKNGLRQKIDLEYGAYVLKLQYAAQSGQSAKSEMSIFWNGQKVSTVKGEDNFVHNFRLPLTAIQGANFLEIGGEGRSDCEGMTIANVRLFSLRNPPKGPNFLKNGNFTETYKGPTMWIG